MKTKRMISTTLASLLILVLSFTVSNSYAQAKTDSTKMQDCCMMKDGQMMYMKDGKTTPMEHNMTMQDGTKCMTSGECIMKDGTKMQMKDGQCMDMSGKMDNCSMMHKDMKSSTDKKNDNKEVAMSYTCPMHPEVTSEKAGKCPKCGIDLIKKK